MIPNQSQIDSIPLSRAAEFELSDKEMQTTRSRLYAINKDGIRKYRTMRHGNILAVWRIE